MSHMLQVGIYGLDDDILIALDGYGVDTIHAFSALGPIIKGIETAFKENITDTEKVSKYITSAMDDEIEINPDSHFYKNYDSLKDMLNSCYYDKSDTEDIYVYHKDEDIGEFIGDDSEYDCWLQVNPVEKTIEVNCVCFNSWDDDEEVEEAPDLIKIGMKESDNCETDWRGDYKTWRKLRSYIVYQSHKGPWYNSDSDQTVYLR